MSICTRLTNPPKGRSWGGGGAYIYICYLYYPPTPMILCCSEETTEDDGFELGIRGHEACRLEGLISQADTRMYAKTKL